ncbi:unknown [Prevotella sp. CAG:732]|nr:unknown [Prevotella sp. CAG:732]
MAFVICTLGSFCVMGLNKCKSLYIVIKSRRKLSWKGFLLLDQF